MTNGTSDRGIAQFVERRPQTRQHVAGEKRFFACAVVKDRYLGGAAASPRSDTSRVVHRQFTPGQTRAYAGQDIAHSSAGHSWIAGGIVADRFTALANNRAASFEQKRNWKFIAKTARDPNACHFANFHQSFHLAGMRREQPRSAASAQNVDFVAENI